MKFQSIINLSSRALTAAEKQVMELGLSFCPTSTFNYTETRIDLYKFTRKLRLHKWFATKPPDTRPKPVTEVLSNLDIGSMDLLLTLGQLAGIASEDADPILNLADTGIDLSYSCPSGFKSKSTFNPPTKNDAIEIFEDLVIRDAKKLSLNRNWKYDNLNAQQRKAITALAEDKTIIIKQSDKGGNVVVMPVEMYIEEGNRQLNDSTCYEKTSKNSIVATFSKYHEMLKEWTDRGSLEWEEFDFLRVCHPRIPALYLLPKIHKNPTKPPGRPIVSCIGSLLEPTSMYIDFFLRPFVAALPAYIQDTGDFLKRIDGLFWADDMWLIGLDVISLYTNIRHEDGISACRFFLKARSLSLYFHNEMLLEMILYCLQNNYFSFQGQHYRQRQGVAMGTCFAPNLANLVMGWWEHTVVEQMKEYNSHVMLWLRFIDDLFIIWQGTDSQAVAFINKLNANNLNLKFTYTLSQQELIFLDTRVSIVDNCVSTSLHRKDTAGNTLLHASSSHPRSLIESIPYGEFVRARRICSSDTTFEDECKTMEARLKARGYSNRCIQNAKVKALSKSRTNLLAPNLSTLESNKPIRFITTYNRHSGALRNILKKHWNVLGCETTLNDALSRAPTITYKRSRNLKDRLCANVDLQVKATHTIANLVGFYPCKSCKACKTSEPVREYINKLSGKTSTINKFLTCTSDHVVYALICPCLLWYVGSTKHPAKHRVLEHRRAITNNDAQYPVARHFALLHNSDPAQLKYFILDRVERMPRGGDRLLALRKLESKYIIGLNTKAPAGLNIDEELVVHLKN